MTSKQSILAAATNQKNLDLLTQVLEKEGYPVLAAGSLEAIDSVLSENSGVGLALLDLAGFDRRIWERCEQMRNVQIPFLLISAKQSTAIRRETITHGAQGLLVKPLVIKELLGLVAGFMEEQHE
ncbi:MAG: response regulator [Desulfosalsimonas sp.]